MRSILLVLISFFSITTALAHNYDPPNFSTTCYNRNAEGQCVSFGATITTTTAGPKEFNLSFDYPRVYTLQFWGATLSECKLIDADTCHYQAIGNAWNRPLNLGFSANVAKPNPSTPQDPPSLKNVTYTGDDPTPPVAGDITLPDLDKNQKALQFILTPGQTTQIHLQEQNILEPHFTLTLTNPALLTSSKIISIDKQGIATLELTPKTISGRSALKIIDENTKATRYIGIVVKNADGSLPAFPNYLALGSVSEDSATHLDFWKDFSDPTKNKRMDIRYIYLNGGPINGWADWTNKKGDRARFYIRNSQMLGMMPFFVFYNIADGGESYDTDNQHIHSRIYMEAYFQNLKLMLDIIKEEAADGPVGVILEPDFIGYMEQNAQQPPEKISAETNAAYSSGVLNTSDPQFKDTLQGLVQAINYTIFKYGNDSGKHKRVYFGWQFNLWSSPKSKGQGVIHSDAATIAIVAKEEAAFYQSAGITSYQADFISIDKYGLDAAGFPGDQKPAENPQNSTWFWNQPLWDNYLLFTQHLHQAVNLPVILWQLPVGHINSTQAYNPYSLNHLFAELNNTEMHYEDSAPDYFLGDTFMTSGERCRYFGMNALNDHCKIIWKSHFKNAADVGVIAALFGAGVGISTNSVGSPPSDDNWWIVKAQKYYAEMGV